MSGGHFDYKEYWVKEIAQQVEEALDIHKNKYKGVYDYLQDCDDEAIKEIEEGAILLRKAYRFAYNVDRLLSGDSGPESVLEDYKEDCENIDKGDYEKGRYYTEDGE